MASSQLLNEDLILIRWVMSRTLPYNSSTEVTIPEMEHICKLRCTRGKCSFDNPKSVTFEVRLVATQSKIDEVFLPKSIFAMLATDK